MNFLIINNTFINKEDISSIQILKVDNNLTTAIFRMQRGENIKLQIEDTKDNVIADFYRLLK